MGLQKSTLTLFLQPLLIALGAALLLRGIFVQTFTIPSSSMEPTLQRGDHIVAVPYGSPLLPRGPQRGDVVVFRGPDTGQQFFVKRIVAAPGDEIEILSRQVRLNGWTLAEPYLHEKFSYEPRIPQIMPDGTFFVMGDHRHDSLDSRATGPVPRHQLVGRAILVFWSAESSDWDVNANASSLLTEAPAEGNIRWKRLFRVVH